MPDQLDGLTYRQFAELEAYVKGKEQERRELAQLQAEALQQGPHGP